MHSGSGRLAVKQKSAVSVYVGIAALLLEGRVLGGDEDDEHFLNINNNTQHQHQVAEEIQTERSSSPTSAATTSSRHGVINRISEKLMRLRQFPGTNKDIVETSIAIPVNSGDECDYERQMRHHHVASSREFQRNPRIAPIPTSTSSSSSAASVLYDIDVDWNDISIILNGLDSLVNVPAFPLKLTSNHQHLFRTSTSLPINQDLNLKLYKNKAPPEKPSSSTLIHAKPKQGPHCEKFLKKIGVLKLDTAELEVDHMCNHVNSFCRRWQFNLKRLLQVLTKAEGACIEVYLGPENNAILLEQWILTLTDNPSSSTMTIQSLCSAIRSQLYFSQISSWSDLLQKAFNESDSSVNDQMPSHLFSPEIMQNPRLKKNLQTMKVELDILFRIKSYDGTSCFNEKPNVHKFPDTIVSDGMAICVCLKSLPRLDKIPTLNTEKAHLNGFACGNRIKSLNVAIESPVAGSSRHIIHDRMTFSSCHEKGKHRCKEDYDEEDEIVGISDNKKENSSSSSASASSTSSIDATQDIPSTSSVSTSSGLTHRERQLLKYKKRLMKRDKQKKKLAENEHPHTSTSTAISNTSSTNINEMYAIQPKDSNYSNKPDINKMEIPLYTNGSASSSSSSSSSKSSGSECSGINKKITAIIINNNSNNSNRIDNISKHALTSTLSIATQTEFNDASISYSSNNNNNSIITSLMPKCDSCGNQLQCLNCDKVKLNNNYNNDNFNQMASPSSSSSRVSCASSSTTTSAVSGTMIGNKADLLLQAIQRTAIAHQNDSNDGVTNKSILRDNLNLNDNIFSNSKIQIKLTTRDSSIANENSDKSNCILINNNNNNNMNNNNNNNIDNNSYAKISKVNMDNNINQLQQQQQQQQLESDCRLCKRQKTKHTPSMNIGSNSSGNIYRRTMSECMVGMSPDEEHIYRSNEGLHLSPPQIHNHSDDLKLNMMSEDDYNKILSYGELKSYRRAFSDDVINQLPNEICCYENSSNNSNNNDDECITIKCRHLNNIESKSSPIHKLTPNVTLQQQQMHDVSLQHKSFQRIPKINLSHLFDSIQPSSSHQLQNDSGIGYDSIDFPSPTNDNVFIFNSPVKSYPPQVQLSPRPSSSINKRRSLRSSLSISEYCSDEDDDILAMKYLTSDKSSKISSLYKKFVTKTQTAFNKFSKLPLLSTIEENLLHNRFRPKSIVEGFKLLLGASGSFCPTQLTIPAHTFFYEFQGTKHMSTPYVCEFRLARKYSIPKFGTVQATLLNPQGTVVRMFFVPYDYRDMPAMSQTFIRQRVLAIDEHISQKNVEQMSTCEQMKHLRYVINLRFQTGRSGRLCLHTDIKLVISRRTEFDTAAAHAKNSLESPNDLKTVIVSPENPKFSSRFDKN